MYKINNVPLYDAYSIINNPLENCYDSDGNLLDKGYDLRIMSYNIQWLLSNNPPEMVQKILHYYKPDVIGCQEAYNGAHPNNIATAFAGYNIGALGLQNNKTMIVTDTKYEMEDYTSKNFAVRYIEARGYNKTYITVKGKRVCLVNTHLETYSNGNGEAAQIAGAKEIFDLVKDEPYFIITGDFNVQCKSKSDPSYNTVIKQFIDAGYDSANCSDKNGWHYTFGNSRVPLTQETGYYLDQIITNLDIVKVEVDKIKVKTLGYWNDHMPIIATLKFKDENSQNQPI